MPLVDVEVAAAQVCAATDLSEADRRALVAALVQRRLITPSAVAAAAARTPKRVRAQVRRLVEELLAGAESGPEAALWRAQVEQCRLPLAMLNHPIGDAGRRIDGYVPELRAGYEVQSREHHADTWLADTARMAEILVRDRVALLPILVQDIEHRMDVVLADLEGFWRNRAADLAVPLPRHVRPPRWQP